MAGMVLAGETLGSPSSQRQHMPAYQPTNRPPASSALLGGPRSLSIVKPTSVRPTLTTTADCAGAGLSGAHAGGRARMPSALGGLGRIAGAHEGGPVILGQVVSGWMSVRGGSADG